MRKAKERENKFIFRYSTVKILKNVVIRHFQKGPIQKVLYNNKRLAIISFHMNEMGFIYFFQISKSRRYECKQANQ